MEPSPREASGQSTSEKCPAVKPLLEHRPKDDTATTARVEVTNDRHNARQATQADRNETTQWYPTYDNFPSQALFTANGALFPCLPLRPFLLLLLRLITSLQRVRTRPLLLFSALSAYSSSQQHGSVQACLPAARRLLVHFSAVGNGGRSNYALPVWSNQPLTT